MPGFLLSVHSLTCGSLSGRPHTPCCQEEAECRKYGNGLELGLCSSVRALLPDRMMCKACVAAGIHLLFLSNMVILGSSVATLPY